MERPLGWLNKEIALSWHHARKCIWIFWRQSNRRSPPSPNSNPRPPYAVRSRFQLPADTDIIPLRDTNMVVFISHCLQVTVFHVSPIPIIQFSPKVLTTRIAVSPFVGFVKNDTRERWGMGLSPNGRNLPWMELLRTVSWLIKYMVYVPSLLWRIQTGTCIFLNSYFNFRCNNSVRNTYSVHMEGV